MSKYVDRIKDEIEFNFDRHFHDSDERIEFLEELIEDVNGLLEDLKCKLEDTNDECGICDEGQCDCEPEVCI